MRRVLRRNRESHAARAMRVRRCTGPGSPEFIVYISNSQPIAARQGMELSPKSKASPKEPTKETPHHRTGQSLNQRYHHVTGKSFGSTTAGCMPLAVAANTIPKTRDADAVAAITSPSPADRDLQAKMSSKNPIRLPPLKRLRAHNTSRSEPNPCIAVMSSVLGMHAPQSQDQKKKKRPN